MNMIQIQFFSNYDEKTVEESNQKNVHVCYKKIIK